MYDWNRKEMVPFASASDCKFCPVMTGASTASWVSTPSLTGLSETLLNPKHGECKGFFFICTVKVSAGPHRWNPGFCGPQPALLKRAGSAEHSQIPVKADNIYLLSQCCFLQGTHLLCTIQ